MKQIDMESLKPGLTIKAVAAGSEYLTILFTDDTFIHVGAAGHDSPHLLDEHVDLECNEYPVRDSERFIELGILDREAYEEHARQYMDAHDARTRQYKLQHYLQLKRELGL